MKDGTPIAADADNFSSYCNVRPTAATTSRFIALFMRILILAVTGKQPGWVTDAASEYAKRLRGYCRLEIVDLKAESRTQGRTVTALLEAEAERLLARIPPAANVIALDERGESFTTQELAATLGKWKQSGEAVVLVIGGPDGLADAVKRRARKTWALSSLTLPHGLAKVLLLEQLYRAASLLEGHPYHRE
jgi:23S rRNA (pseudouridine1915-N3)-methyltransferase